MRVATNSYTDSMLSQFGVLADRLNNLQKQSSTGLAVESASDNPTAMQSTLNYLSDKATQTQYSSNISTLKTRATAVGNALSSLQTLTSRAQELVTSATSGTAAQSNLDSYASEVQQLTQEAVQLMNTKDASTGQYLFGGTNSTVPPYVATTDANGNITGVTYQGNASVNQTEIAPGVTVAVDVPGANTDTSGVRGMITDATSGADLFNHLITFANDLTSGDTSAISGTDSTNLQNDSDNVLYQVSSNGAVQTHLESAATFVSSQSTSLDTLISNTSGANLSDTLVQLSQAQTAYQAALESSAKVMGLSILNYLS
jgi:flagellar hook-associated protein 3 FlgL